MRVGSFSSLRLALVPGLVAVSVGACAYRQEKGGAAGDAAHSATLSPSFAQVRDQVLTPKCTSCHHHQSDFADYPHTFADRQAIQEKVFVDHTMPQGDSLSGSQSSLLQQWLSVGAPEQAVQNTTPGVLTPTPPLAPLAPTWANVQKHFFALYCTHCHSGDNPDGDLDLTELSQIRPISSKIMDRVFFNTEKPMPPKKASRDKITAEDKMLLIGWIAAKMPGADGVTFPPTPAVTPTPKPTPVAPPTPGVSPAPTAAPAPSTVPSPSPATAPAPPDVPSPEPVNPPRPPAPESEFAEVRAQVLVPKCVSCHYHQSDFADYADTFDEREDIERKVFVDHSMPRTGTLTPEQSSLLQSWLTE